MYVKARFNFEAEIPLFQVFGFLFFFFSKYLEKC